MQLPSNDKYITASTTLLMLLWAAFISTATYAQTDNQDHASFAQTFTEHVNNASNNEVDVFSSSQNMAESFLAVEEAYQLDIDITKNEINQTSAVSLIWQAQPKYYFYKHGFKQFIKHRSTVNEEQIINGDIPTGIITQDEYFGEVETYYNQVVIPLNIPAHMSAFKMRLQSQGCADAGLCYPPYDIYVEVNLLTGSIETLSAANYNSNNGNLDKAGPESLQSDITALKMTFLLALMGAFLGGLILNLMPCVLPVLSIKLLQIQQAGSHAKLHGLSYMAGVIISFLCIAIALISLRQAGQSVGWGFQLQQPWVIAALACLFFTLALSLSGYFELGSRLMGLGQSSTSNSSKPGSAFITGILAVIVATPCTAPFMGTALGFALTQTNTNALLIFASLGFGMALPLTAITFVPALHQWLPKPGMWMVRLKEFFAFPLYLSCVWLLWVLANQTSTTTLAFVLIALVAITFAIWCFNTQALLLKVAGVVALILSAFLFSGDTLKPQNSTTSNDHLKYSAQNLTALRTAGKAVFIDLTADWCITCLANEKSTLNRPDIQAAFKQADIAYMVGDWTNFNPEITALLEQYQRSGIPLYLLFPPRVNAAPTILPQILTPSIVLTAISKNK